MTYTITMPFRHIEKFKSDEISITSENLIYSEIYNLNGVQCLNPDNEEKITRKCEQIAILIREIEELNK